jgi:hypothetical protein
MPLGKAKAQVSDSRRNRQQPTDRRSTPLPGLSRQCRRGDLNLPGLLGSERHDAAYLDAELHFYARVPVPTFRSLPPQAVPCR